MATWMPIGLGEDDREGLPTRFLIDNDVYTWLLRQMQGVGVSIVQLEPRLRKCSDDVVLAEAKRQDRVLITHDRRFVSPRQIDRDANPGIVVIPRGDAGRLDWSLISAVLANVVLYRELYDQTVLQLYPSGRFTLWNPNEHTDRMEPIFGRVSEERELQAWVDDDYEPAPNPEY